MIVAVPEPHIAPQPPPHTATHLKYRPDIDGLRAIAVLLVVFNHVGSSFFSGGFIGVDVFFVISGYLITGIIYKQHLAGTFSFKDFYLRRARRILPALYGVLLCVTATAYFVYTPSDYSTLAQSAVSAILFSANIFFWLTSGGYFSANAEELPLLHIWSLSVEEQYYFVWPIILLLLLKLRNRSLRIAIVAIALVLSFVWAQVGVHKQLSSAYFLLPSRAGELLVGSLLAFWAQHGGQAKVNGVRANMLSGLGLLLVIAPALYLGKASGFPGLNALVPCIGAGLIIAAPRFGPSVGTRLLSSKPMVAVGLISYSLYLWHWPLLAFLRYSRIAIDLPIAIAVVAASLALGYLSWRFIERTFRHNGVPMKTGLAISGTCLCLLTLATPAIIYFRDGMPARFPYAMLTQDQLTAERNRYWQDNKTTDTSFSAAPGVKKVLIVGNSHAFDLSYALTENHFDGQIKLIGTLYQCFNFGYDAVLVADADLCKQRLNAVLTSPELKTADAVYLHDNWAGKNLADLEAMLHALRAVTQAPIYVLGPKMVFADSVINISKYAQNARRTTTAGINDFSRSYQAKTLVAYDKELQAFFAAKAFRNVKYVSALTVQCGPQLDCDILSHGGEYLYFDAGHFTLIGARLFGQKLKAAYAELF